MGIYATDPSELYTQVCHYALGYLAFAIIAGLLMFTQTSCYRYIGERITSDLRVVTFAYVETFSVLFCTVPLVLPFRYCAFISFRSCLLSDVYRARVLERPEASLY